jgi:hypothetical protein
MLTGAHKTKKMASAYFIAIPQGWRCISHIVRVTGNETWVSLVNVETEQQPMQWIHIHSPNKPKKSERMLSARKLMITVFWGRKGMLMVESMK